MNKLEILAELIDKNLNYIKKQNDVIKEAKKLQNAIKKEIEGLTLECNDLVLKILKEYSNESSVMEEILWYNPQLEKKGMYTLPTNNLIDKIKALKTQIYNLEKKYKKLDDEIQFSPINIPEEIVKYHFYKSFIRLFDISSDDTFLNCIFSENMEMIMPKRTSFDEDVESIKNVINKGYQNVLTDESILEITDFIIDNVFSNIKLPLPNKINNQSIYLFDYLKRKLRGEYEFNR